MKKRTSVVPSSGLCVLVATLPVLAIPAFGAAYPDAVKGDKPLAYYRFNDSRERPSINANSGSLGATGNATNINVHAVSGAIVGSHNAAAYFDSTARTIVPWAAELNPDASQSFTIEAWFCPTSDKVAGKFVGPAPIMNRYSGPVKNRQGWVYFQRNPDSRPYGNGQSDVGWNFRMYNGSGSTVGAQITSGVPYKLGVWQHVVTVWDTADPDNPQLIMYVDGVEAVRKSAQPGNYVANTDDHGDESAINGPAGLSIGSYNNTEAGSNPFRGGIDEVAFYNKALTADQIKAHYDNALDASRTIAYDALVKSDAPVGYWRLDDPTPGPDVAVNMGLLQNAGAASNTAEVGHPVQGALAGSQEAAYTYHFRNGSSTTDLPFNESMNPEATQPFTIEAWFRPTSDRQNPGAASINNRYVKSGHRTGWVFFQRAPNASYTGVGGFEGVGWNFRMYNGVNGSGEDVVSKIPYNVGEWQHVVATWSGGDRVDDGSGPARVVGTSTLYINGQLAAQNTHATYTANQGTPEDGDPANASDFAIGSYNRASGLGNNPFEGDIDEVAFYNVQLSDDQIAAHYAAGVDTHGSQEYANMVLTAPYDVVVAGGAPGADALQPVSYFRLSDKSVAPASNSGTAGDVADASITLAQPPASGPQAPAFPGFESDNAAAAIAAKSWVSLDNPGVLNLSGKLTLEAWINPEAAQGAVARILSHGPPTLSSYVTDPVTRDGALLVGNEVFLSINANGTDYQFGTILGLPEGNENHVVSAAVPAGDLGSGQWVHLVGTYDGTIWRIYRNGVEAAAMADPIGALSVDNGGWGIGSKGNGWEDAFAGAIDEVAIYNDALSATQVASHYAAALGAVEAKISIARDGNNVVVTFSGGKLQSADSITGTFTDVNNAVSPLTIASPTGTRFYRVSH